MYKFVLLKWVWTGTYINTIWQILILHFVFINEWLSALSKYNHVSCEYGINMSQWSSYKLRTFLVLCIELDLTWAFTTDTYLFHTDVSATFCLLFNLIQLWQMTTPTLFFFLKTFFLKLQLSVKRRIFKINRENVEKGIFNANWNVYFVPHLSYKSYCNDINVSAALKVMMRLHTEEQSICVCGEERVFRVFDDVHVLKKTVF